MVILIYSKILKAVCLYQAFQYLFKFSEKTIINPSTPTGEGTHIK